VSEPAWEIILFCAQAEACDVHHAPRCLFFLRLLMIVSARTGWTAIFNITFCLIKANQAKRNWPLNLL
jgi:hypothetical protein